MISRTKRKYRPKDDLNDEGVNASWLDPDWDRLDDATEELREEFGRFKAED